MATYRVRCPDLVGNAPENIRYRHHGKIYVSDEDGVIAGLTKAEAESIVAGGAFTLLSGKGKPGAVEAVAPGLPRSLPGRIRAAAGDHSGPALYAAVERMQAEDPLKGGELDDYNSWMAAQAHEPPPSAAPKPESKPEPEAPKRRRRRTPAKKD